MKLTRAKDGLMTVQNLIDILSKVKNKEAVISTPPFMINGRIGTGYPDGVYTEEQNPEYGREGYFCFGWAFTELDKQISRDFAKLKKKGIEPTEQQYLEQFKSA